ncbi:hypothetical protein C8Q77DRAFT_46878 [Trametes polyzona]|nr:hypothetical protein C8Q77DRAFT_46878 [Trametes polyzona]
MKSPILAFSFFAATATVSGQSLGAIQGVPLSPQLQANVGSYHTQLPRAYPAASYPRPQEDRARGGEREATRLGHNQPPRLSSNHGAMPIPQGDNLSGGVSGTAPAVGGDAASGGGDASSTDASPASGSDILNLGDGVQNALSGESIASTPDSSSDEPTDTSYETSPGYAYTSRRLGRMLRIRDDGLVPYDEGVLELPNQDDDPDNENSNHDGADGVSQRGSEIDGEGPYGGHAHSGQVGSSEGGHVYNSPASST